MSVSRSFTDAAGVAWLVYEVTPLPLSPRLEAKRPVERRRPWLVFESAAGAKRRLAPIPAEWPRGSVVLLEEWCAAAVSIPPAPARREVDDA